MWRATQWQSKLGISHGKVSRQAFWQNCHVRCNILQLNKPIGRNHVYLTYQIGILGGKKPCSLTFDVQFDFGGGWLSEAVVCQADVDPRVVSRHFGERQWHALGWLTTVRHLASLLPAPLHFWGWPPLGHLAGQSHRLSSLGHDDPVRGSGFHLGPDWKRQLINA